MYVDLVWLLEFLELVGKLKEIYDTLVALAEDDPAPPVVEMTDEQRLEALKDATLLVRKLNLNLACYPLSDAAVVFFDEDGNFIPSP